MRTLIRPALTLSLTAVLLSGCASAFTAPGADLPGAYPHATPTGQPVAGNWWTRFGDARADRLVAAVLARNTDLAAATLSVRRARLQAGLATAALAPQGSGQLSGERADDGAESYSAQAEVSYAVDLFGKLGAERDAARWEARATTQDLEATSQTLIGTTLQLYWTLAYLNQQIASGEQSLTYVKTAQALVEAQYKAGAVSAVELNEARRSVETQAAELAALNQSRTESRNALTVLLAGQAWPEADEPQTLSEAALPAVAAGVPADLVARRPDLRAAELRLRGALRSVDAARASFYPAITLTASGGGSSADLKDVLANPTAALGVGVTLPFLNFPTLDLNLKVSRLDYEQAVVLFRGTLVQAFTDVDNALSNRQRLAERGAALDAAATAARRTEQLYGARYRAGAVTLRVWLDAQESARSAELSAAANRRDQLVAQATLYQALGGGTVG